MSRFIACTVLNGENTSYQSVSSLSLSFINNVTNDIMNISWLCACPSSQGNLPYEFCRFS